MIVSQVAIPGARVNATVVEHSSGPSGGPRYDGGRLKSGALPDISHVEYEGFERDEESENDQTHEVVTAVRLVK